MSLESVVTEMKQRFAYANFGHTAKFDFDVDGLIFVDATQSPPLISHENNDAEVTLKCSLQVFENILNGTQDPNIAFMMGKLKVEGSMGLALKLNGILEN